MTLDKISVHKMTVDRMTLEKMIVDKMAWSQRQVIPGLLNGKSN